MNINLLLKGNNTYSWTNFENIFFMGYFFDENNELHQNIEATIFVFNELKKKTRDEFCNSINGLFTFIIAEENQHHLVSDSVNYFPLFYTFKNNEWTISDDWKSIIEYQKNFSKTPKLLMNLKPQDLYFLTKLSKKIFTRQTPIKFWKSGQMKIKFFSIKTLLRKIFQINLLMNYLSI
jgi:asparagine synthetase B (glutamine-hydrolysing)